MRSRHISLLLCVVTLLFFSSLDVVSAASIKDRMAARIPAINALKDKGNVGENSAGYLAFRTGDKSGQDVVTAENGDRKKVYGAIAKKQNVAAELVGQRRATMIAAKGKKGHWFQSADGKWYQK